MKTQSSLFGIIIGLILIFMFLLIPEKESEKEPEMIECEVHTIPATHTVVFYYACGLTSWDGEEWNEPTPFEERRIEIWNKNTK